MFEFIIQLGVLSGFSAFNLVDFKVMNVSGIFFFFALIPDVMKLLRIQIVRKNMNQSHNFDLI